MEVMVSDMIDWIDELQVFCADIGSVAQGNFAWARRLPAEREEELHQPGSIDALARSVCRQIERGRPVALGLEMPLFVPVPTDSQALGKARPCEKGAPPWSGGPGGAVMATGLVQAAWLLRKIRSAVGEPPLYFRWAEFADRQSGLLMWEAFVSGKAKGSDHEADARVGVEAFCKQLPNVGDSDADETEHPLSLISAAAAWAGWSFAADAIRVPCTLVRAIPSAVD
jgi:hypothetical protein